MPGLEWTMKPQADESVLKSYAHLPFLQALLLWQRGVGPETAGDFLSPAYEKLFSPFSFSQMEQAVERIWRAVLLDEQILIYADYDADAVTACSVLLRTFEYLGVGAKTYIPDRFSEGYGLNVAAFEQFAREGVGLVVTVDCGINARVEATRSKELGIDLIITDHHELIGDLPEALAIINPKVPDSGYPDDQITGVGVAYKLAAALLSDHERVKASRTKRLGKSDVVAGWDKWLLDLVAIGTVADCHSLLGENRILVHYGLQVLAKTKWPGLGEILNTARVDRDSLSVYTLGFVLAPRINAAGRLEHANIAKDALGAKDQEEALKLAALLEQINTRRQEASLRMITEARDQAAVDPKQKVLVLASSDWHRGLVGIVAGRLATEMGKPVIVLEEKDGLATGSARSYGEFDILAALTAASEFLVKYGGHKQAAGLTLKTEHLDSFRVKINEYASLLSDDGLRPPSLQIDALLDPSEVNLDTFDLVSELEPFGAGNPLPVFLVNNLVIDGWKKVGAEQSHLQLIFRSVHGVVSGIGFQKGFWTESFSLGDQVQVVAELMADTWNGVRRMKLRIIDMKKITHI